MHAKTFRRVICTFSPVTLFSALPKFFYGSKNWSLPSIVFTICMSTSFTSVLAPQPKINAVRGPGQFRVVGEKGELNRGGFCQAKCRGKMKSIQSPQRGRK